MKTTVDFLRHGEVEGGSCYRGSTNDPLSQKGWQQMREAVADRQWDQVISSPLQRCSAFSQHLHMQTNTPLLVKSGWQEICFGDWEGKKAEQINSEQLIGFYQDPVNNTPNNGEGLNNFLVRINLAWSSLLKDHAGKKILVISHAGVIRCLFHLFLNLPIEKIFNIQINHSSITRFQCFHDTPLDFISLVFHNFIQPDLYLEL